MPPLSFEKRQELVNRINGGQRISGPTGIAAEMGIAVKTIYRLKAKFTQADGSFEVQAAAVAKKQAFTRETLVEISQWLQAEPKLTLKELRERLVEQENPTCGCAACREGTLGAMSTHQPPLWGLHGKHRGAYRARA